MGLYRPVFPAVLPATYGALGGALPWEATGSGSVTALDLTTGGTFTRSSEGSYLIGAPTDGSTAFLAWAPNDVRRIEDRGDGLGSMLLMEGSRTNYILYNQDFANAYWTPLGTLTPAYANGPDGTLTAARNQVLSASVGTSRHGINGLPTATVFYATSWAKRLSGAGSGLGQLAIDSPSTGDATGVLTLSDSIYQRLEVTTSVGGLNPWIYPWCGSGSYGTGGTNSAVDYISNLIQAEVGGWPSSAIRTTSATITRSADVLTYAVGQYPSSFLTRGLLVSVAPDFSSAEIAAAGTTCVIVYEGTNNALWLIGNAGVCRAELWAGGTRLVQPTITFSRGQLLSFAASPSLGGVSSLTVSGATSGNGTYTGTATPWTAAATMYIGANFSGANNWFGRFSPIVRGL